MATPVDNAVSATSNPLVEGLIHGSSWQFGATRVLTYSLSLNDSVGADGAPYGGSWTFNPLADAVRRAFVEWSNVANIHFVELGSGTVFSASAADIAVTLTGDELGGVGIGFFPSPATAREILADTVYADPAVYPRPEGDIFFDNFNSELQHVYAGGIGFMDILHEIGHALGLKHPFDRGSSGQRTFAELGIAARDNTDQTVMSYTDPQGFDVWGNPATPMLLDILAIQHIYGPNTSFRSGDDYYSFTGSDLRTIWDAGGTDTLSAWGNGAVIDLRPGHFSDSGNDRVVIAYNVIIENAVGTFYNDSIVGNDADNVLDGGDGVDWMQGGKGNDTYVVGATNDTVIESAGEGTDTVQSSVAYLLGNGLENLTLRGTANISGSGNEADNTLLGNSGANILTGFGGNDWLDGGKGFDVMRGGRGDDTYVVAQADASNTATVLNLRGDPGAYLLNGETRSLSPYEGTLKFDWLNDYNNDGLIDHVQVSYWSFDGEIWWSLHLGARTGENLQPGTYTNTQHYPDTNHEALNLFGEGRGENMSGGAFTLYAADFNYSGQSPSVDRFFVEFQIPAASGGAFVTGTLRYRYGTGVLIPETVLEFSNEGTDTVRSSVPYSLPDHVEHLLLTGLLAIDGTGNELDNVITGNSANNIIAGAAGNDTLVASGGFDVLDGGANIDTADFTDFSSAVWVNLGYSGVEAWTTDRTNIASGTWRSIADLESVENLVGTAYADELYGNGGDNVLSYTGGADRLDGEGGVDTADFSRFGSAVWVNLSHSQAEAWTTDRSSIASGSWRAIADLADIENVTGTAFADELYGNAANNVLNYTGGVDRLDGAGGVDTADFSRFGSSVWVNLGYGQAEAWTTDRASIASGTWRAIADLQSIENLTGTSFADELYGDAGNNVLNYTGGVDRLDGAGGVDTADFSRFGSAVWVNLAYGQTEAWTTDRSSIASGTWRAIADLANVENLTGTNQADYLQGDAGSNRIEGGAGHDVLVSSPGADWLVGGEDADRFEYHTIDVLPDTISDFTTGSSGDQIDLRSVLVGYQEGTSNAGNFVRLVASGGSTTVSVNADGVGSDFTAMAVLQGVGGLVLNDMLANSNLLLV